MTRGDDATTPFRVRLAAPAQVRAVSRCMLCALRSPFGSGQSSGAANDASGLALVWWRDVFWVTATNAARTAYARWAFPSGYIVAEGGSRFDAALSTGADWVAVRVSPRLLWPIVKSAAGGAGSSWAGDGGGSVTVTTAASVEQMEIRLDERRSSVVVETVLAGAYGERGMRAPASFEDARHLRRRYRLFCEELPTCPELSLDASRWHSCVRASGRVFCSALANVHRRVGQVTLRALPHALQLASFVEGAAAESETGSLLLLRTEVHVDGRDLDAYEGPCTTPDTTGASSPAGAITFALRPFATAMEFADRMDVPATLRFGAAGYPLCVQLRLSAAPTSAGIVSAETAIEAEFVLATRSPTETLASEAMPRAADAAAASNGLRGSVRKAAAAPVSPAHSMTTATSTESLAAAATDIRHGGASVPSTPSPRRTPDPTRRALYPEHADEDTASEADYVESTPPPSAAFAPLTTTAHRTRSPDSEWAF
ncbi:hypothetical protein CDCA_CDCA05G1572 [Cyanidium caldarium]|uniref:Uncharacterized protein n=1 Tax=Cyanidium caldarium TaxID=2771 RepID=A0AAV9IT94_CYACA|nr:hypothetical protein CDCA_CDCA05G1572 [Cyanidium caldarium]